MIPIDEETAKQVRVQLGLDKDGNLPPSRPWGTLPSGISCEAGNYTDPRIETYSSDIKCHNCGAWVRHRIPVGTTREQFENTGKCVNCGCRFKKKRFGLF